MHYFIYVNVIKRKCVLVLVDVNVIPAFRR